jgi:hypothetical protein
LDERVLAQKNLVKLKEDRNAELNQTFERTTQDLGFKKRILADLEDLSS